MVSGQRRWHLLQVSDVLDEELATALGADVELLGWVPQRSFSAWPRGRPVVSRGASKTENWLRVSLPLLRGFSRLPVWLNRIYLRSVMRYMHRATNTPGRDVLICTVPYFAAVAETWDGPVVYWLTDHIAAYRSARGFDIAALDRRMCKVATLVCPNSNRLAEYLQRQACDANKIVVLPNATRAKNLVLHPLYKPEPMGELATDSRPIAGIIGNLAGNMDWLMLKTVILQTPWLRWVFVGSVTMQIQDRKHEAARADVQLLENTQFVGKKPYGQLASFARSFDVAILPYLRCEPTYSGSSTRFYEHLAACRPMIATRGFEELLRKEPFLKLVDTAEEMMEALQSLRAHGFDDGHVRDRWIESQHGTWEQRSSTLQTALNTRLSDMREAVGTHLAS